jgi:alpha/beta hydrolase family protein
VITGAGLASNVVGLVYLAAFAPADFLWHRQDSFHDSFCQDLDETEALVMAKTQRPLARRCLDDLTGESAWQTKPSWYQVSTQDRMLAPQTQRKMAQRMVARQTIELDTSHASLVTRTHAGTRIHHQRRFRLLERRGYVNAKALPSGWNLRARVVTRMRSRRKLSIY